MPNDKSPKPNEAQTENPKQSESMQAKPPSKPDPKESTKPRSQYFSENYDEKQNE